MSGASFFSPSPFLRFSESVALSISLDDVDAVCEPLKRGAGEPLVSEDFSLCSKRQVGGHNDAGAFVVTAYHFEEERGPGKRKRSSNHTVATFPELRANLTFQHLADGTSRE